MRRKVLIGLLGLVLLTFGCIQERPVEVLGLDKPSKLLNLEKHFGITGTLYGGFLSGTSGHIGQEAYFSFAVEVQGGTCMLLTFPSYMFTFDFAGEEPTVTLRPTRCTEDGPDAKAAIRKAPGRYLAEKFEDGRSVFVASIQISLPAALKPKGSITLW